MLRKLLLVLALAAAAGVSGADAPPFLVIVHHANPIQSITRAELSAIYLERLRSWPDGNEIHVYDQSSKSRVRAQFSQRIHGKSVAYVIRYWQRLIFSGRGVPPRELDSSEKVIEAVRNNPHAIGYIERDRIAPGDVKVIPVMP